MSHGDTGLPSFALDWALREHSWLPMGKKEPRRSRKETGALIETILGTCMDFSG